MIRRIFDRACRLRSSESGATLVLAAVSMVALLGFAGLVIDMGMIYSERRALQNGADSAALTLARECAEGYCTPAYDEYAVAETYADGNSHDGAAWVKNVQINASDRTVRVRTVSEDTEGNNALELMFAPVVGLDTVIVEAEATVEWGAPSRLAALPLVYSKCEWLSFGESGFVDEGPGFVHRAEAVRDGLLPPSTGYAYESRFVTIYFHGSSTCHDSESGQDLPGGFGWVDTTSAECIADVSISDIVSVEPGASPTTECSPVDMAAKLGTVQLIPYFDDFNGNGTGGEYTIYGFGAIYMTGYNFGGSYKEPSLIDGALPCTGEDRCVQGYLIGEWSALDDPGAPLGDSDLGVYVLRMQG